MPIQEQQHGFSLQELICAIEEVDTKPSQLQLILQNSPNLFQEYGEELLSVVMQRCDITTPSGSEFKLFALNICWKVLLAILTNSHVSQSVYELGTSFMLDQLHHSVFSHDWTDSKLIKISTFFASHITFTAKAYPRYFLCSRENALVRRVVSLSVSVSFTIASSELDDDILRPLCDNVLLRLKTILEYLGSVSINTEEGAGECLANRVTMKEVDAAASLDNSRYVDLLYQCISEVDVTEMMNASGGDSCFVSMLLAVASLACFLSAACGLLQKLTLTHIAVPSRCPQLLLKALIQWMPSVSFELQGSLHTEDSKTDYGSSCPSKASLASIPSYFNDKETRLLSRIKELSDYLPLSALWQTNCPCPEATDDSFSVKCEKTESLHEQWVNRVIEVLSIVLRGNDQKQSLVEEADNTSTVLTCVLMGLSTPHFQNTTLMMEVYLGLFLRMSHVGQSQCVSTNRHVPESSLKDENYVEHLSILFQIGLLVFSECSLAVCSKDEHNCEDQKCCCIYRGRLQASLLTLIGAESAVVTGLPPSALATRMGPHLMSPLLNVLPIFLSLADYCFFIFTDECGLQENAQCKTEVSSSIKSVNNAFENLLTDTPRSDQFERGSPVFLFRGSAIDLPLALSQLRFAFIFEPFSTPTDEKIGEYHSALLSFQSMFAALTNAVQHITTAIDGKASDIGNADPIACFLLISSLLREAAYFPLDTSRDQVLVACIRRWVELSLKLASCSLARLQPAFSELLQYHAARSLFFFVECNTYVSIEQLNLSEAAVRFLMRFFQSLEDKDDRECFAPHISNGEVNQRLLETFIRYFDQSRKWQTVCSLYRRAQMSDSTDICCTGNLVVSNLLDSMQQCQASLCRLLGEQHWPIDGCCIVPGGNSCEDVGNDEVASVHFSQKNMHSGDSKGLTGIAESSFNNQIGAKEALELSLCLRELLRIGHMVDSVLFRTARRGVNESVESGNVSSLTGSTDVASPLLAVSVEALSPCNLFTQNSLGNTADTQG